MKVKLILVGKTDLKYINEGNAEYQKRLKHYLSTEIVVIPDIKNTKNLSENQQKKKEGELIIQNDILTIPDKGLNKEGDLIVKFKIVKEDKKLSPDVLRKLKSLLV